jgi:serralysin
MPTPTTSGLTTAVSLPNSQLTGYQTIDALLPENARKWGDVLGTNTALTFSFAWINGLGAVYAGPEGRAYSSLSEPDATYHYGLSVQQQTAARQALSSWAAVANLTFKEVPETSTQVGDIRFAWTSATDTSSTGKNAWGWASYPNSYWPSAGDVWLSSSASGTASTDWSPGSYNLMALIHELGHALGLKHTFEGNYTLPTALDVHTYSVMSYTDATHQQWVDVTQNPAGGYSQHSTAIEPSTPMVGDILAIQYLYGANTNYNNGDNVYDFDPTKPFFQTIWDTGGQDTISAAKFTLPCSINLNEGSYSSLGFKSNWSQYAQLKWNTVPDPQTMYDGTNNLGIAWGVVIENATGGSGDDVLIGNPSNNRLQGGSGNDTLRGGDGTDTAVYIGNVKGYSLRIDRAHQTESVTDQQANRDGQDTLSSIERLQFADVTLNLTSYDTAKTITATQLQQIEELYVAFFNRIPDADGLSYWITQIKTGKTISDIASSFYTAGVQYTTLTGYSANMSNTDFINTLYKHVLGRTDGADAVGLSYWNKALINGQATRSSLVSDILTSAHTFKGDPIWGWVANLLDNKISVANTAAVTWGVNYNTPEQSITQDMAIAAAVTPTDTQAALKLIGINLADATITLV